MGLEVFTFDNTTPKPQVVIEDDILTRVASGGWVTVRAAQPLTSGNHQWGVKILNQGEGTDGTGLMLGIMPKVPSTTLMGTKYISELGGWCLSRAGETYGSWNCDRLSFSTGSVVEFDLDVASKTLHICCGKQRVVGQIAAITESGEYYPAFSVYYTGQKIHFV